MRSRYGRALPACLMIAATACSSSVGKLASLPPAPVAAYRLGPGDEMRVVVPGLPGADGTGPTFVVNDRGAITLPVLGDVPAEGRTVPDLQTEIGAALVSRQLLLAPTVSVQPVRLRPYFVTGEVKSPGEYPYHAGMSVLAAVSSAGGFTFRADQKAVEISRLRGGAPVIGRAGPRDMIQPGDTIRVVEKWF